MKAISTIIVIVLIILIVIVLAALIYAFLFGILTETTEIGTVMVNKTAIALSSCMYIESAAENKIYLRNCGKGVIASDKLAVYIDNTTMDFEASPDFAYKDDLMIIIPKELWRFPLGKHNLRITSPYVQALKSIETFRSDSRAVLAFKFDEGSGTTAFDSSGCDNDGTLYNGEFVCSDTPDCPKWVDGKFGKALKFESGVDNDYVGVPHNETLEIDDKNFTIEAWIRTSSTSSNMSIADVYTDFYGPDVGWLFTLEDGKIKLYIGNLDPPAIGFAIGTSDLRDGLWHYVFGNYNGSFIQVYADGKQEGVQSYTGNIWYGHLPEENVLHVGVRCDTCNPLAQGQQFNGIIDEIRIYNVSLNPYETIMLKLRI